MTTTTSEPCSRRLPHAQPCQGHIRAGPLEFHRAPTCALRKPCGYRSLSRCRPGPKESGSQQL